MHDVPPLHEDLVRNEAEGLPEQSSFMLRREAPYVNTSYEVVSAPTHRTCPKTQKSTYFPCYRQPIGMLIEVWRYAKQRS